MEECVNGSVDKNETTSSKRRREDKIRKRDPKAWDNVNKSITSLSDTEKIDSIAKKYIELYDEFRKVSQNSQNLEKSYALLQKEKEHMRSEQAKSILARSRLENLCRELQKLNKQIKEEHIVKMKEEEERRREVASKFQKTLDDVTTMMNDNREKNYKLRDDNIDMSKKISELYEEFQRREEDIKRMSKQMDLEKQLAKSTITKLEYELKAERELWSKERNILQTSLEQSEAKNKQLIDNIKSMEEHLSVYKGQYEDFESTLDKSNKIFDNCKSEMVKMSKQIVLLEKEVNNWKSKWQVSATSLIELSTLKQNQDIQLSAADKKIEQLQKLCRQLQVDRGSFLKLLKTNGIEPISQVCVENTEKPPTSKERELVILKDSLRMLQDQLRYSLNNATDNTEASENKENKKIENPRVKSDENVEPKTVITEKISEMNKSQQQGSEDKVIEIHLDKPEEVVQADSNNTNKIIEYQSPNEGDERENEEIVKDESHVEEKKISNLESTADGGNAESERVNEEHLNTVSGVSIKNTEQECQVVLTNILNGEQTECEKDTTLDAEGKPSEEESCTIQKQDLSDKCG